MALDVYFPDDVEAVLCAARGACLSALKYAPDTPETRAYQDGVETALAAVSVAFKTVKARQYLGEGQA
jgi:hypothetical protein